MLLVTVHATAITVPANAITAHVTAITAHATANIALAIAITVHATVTTRVHAIAITTKKRAIVGFERTTKKLVFYYNKISIFVCKRPENKEKTYASD